MDADPGKPAPTSPSSMTRADRMNEPSVAEWLNPFRVQRGTFVTLRSASECEQILIEHTKHPSLIVKLFYHRGVKRKEPIYEGFATNTSFTLRESKRWIKGTAPALTGTIREGDDGTTIEVNLRVPVVEALVPLVPVPTMIVLGLLYGDALKLITGTIIALLVNVIAAYFLWSHRNAWDDYTWFLETFLSATL